MIDLTQNIFDTEGNIAKLTHKKSSVVDGKEVETFSQDEVTIGSIIADCMLYEIVDPTKMTEKEHLMRYDIYERVKNKEQVELTEEEIKIVEGGK